MPPCFCGSGKEEKYCHPDVHPLSTVGRMLVFYRDLDISIGNLGNVCIQSCCDCCYDYFYISLKEFFAILHFIRSQRGEWYLKKKILMAKDNLEALKRQSPEEYQRLNSTFDKIPLDISMVRKLFNDTQYVKKLNRPCIFLQHGQCEIYQVRPYICRLYGSAISTSSNIRIPLCPKIDKNILYDISRFDVRRIELIDWTKGTVNRPYPIIDFFGSFLPLLISRNSETLFSSYSQPE